MAQPRTDQAGDVTGKALEYRGVAYDAGTNFATGQGDLSRMAWSRRQMLEELSLISDQLNCNSITIYGSDLGRLRETAEAAVERDLHVRLQPRLVDRPQGEVLDHLAEAARLAEALRQQDARIDLTVGAVHLLFTPGIADGEQYHERMANAYADADHHLLKPTGRIDFAEAAPRLNEFLARASGVAQQVFAGPISYSAAPFEQVDWSLFDRIGLMWQYLPTYHTPEQHRAVLDSYRRWGLPIQVAEFGTATYQGAEEKAFFFWDVVDRSGDTPLVFDGVVRDEGRQAAYHLRMFELFEQAGVNGVWISEFIHPTHPHSPDPRLDLDTASMAIVKTIRDDFADTSSTYRVEPKESFHAVADHYAHLGFQAARR
ncbi:abortive infection protein [Micromonospora sp. WMMD710]|uniref:abortive infection protein n=1 Tax=Micromonospora sp. WMMD710 TaxID=3016085 RepID=UPI0024159973|nr:abortive infection protein [Micromonospora sp. WMMD710]MDG4758524.1 abortive infection protein [Micromonospora sp. WMMD710]